jgi:hypothetical protein
VVIIKRFKAGPGRHGDGKGKAAEESDCGARVRGEIGATLS